MIERLDKSTLQLAARAGLYKAIKIMEELE